MAVRLAPILTLLVAFAIAGTASVHAYEFAAADYARGQAQAVEFMGYLNAARQSRGLAPLELRQELSNAARRHAADLLARGIDIVYGHVYDGVTDVDRALAAGWPNQSLGSNEAMEYESVYETFVAWMNSEGHRNTMLSDGLKYAGFGLAWEKKPYYFYDTRYVLYVATPAFDGAEIGTPGTAADTIGMPDRADWGKIVGGTWYGFEAVQVPGRDQVATLPLRNIRVKLAVGERVRPSSRINPLVKLDRRALRLEIIKGRMPKGMRLNRKTGRLRGKARKRGRSGIHLINRTVVGNSSSVTFEPIRVIFKVR